MPARHKDPHFREEKETDEASATFTRHFSLSYSFFSRKQPMSAYQTQPQLKNRLIRKVGIRQLRLSLTNQDVRHNRCKSQDYEWLESSFPTLTFTPQNHCRCDQYCCILFPKHTAYPFGEDEIASVLARLGF
jgi:hypothetical protein